ncbi:MAG TPA: hypothetical protein VFF52_07570 [Isosphaeraceae bacterium]|nr:hypothetical protein [Isosphaeraceae bacterium]
MAGFGRYKLTDALPQEPARAEDSLPGGPGRGGAGNYSGRGKGQRKGKGRPAGEAGKSSSAGLAAEQLREARESTQAKNAEASTRDRMVEIGRGNQQAGRQRGK